MVMRRSWIALAVCSLVVPLMVLPAEGMAARVDDDVDLSLDDVGEGSKAKKPKAPREVSVGELSDGKSIFRDPIKAVQKKPVLKSLRVELEPLVGLTLNDPFYTHIMGGAMLTFYIHDSFALGLRGLYFGAHARSTNHRVLRLAQTAIPAVYELPDWSAIAVATWSPIHGKFSFARRFIVPFDIYVFGGGGIVGVGENLRPAVDIGSGYRVFLNRWLAVRVEVSNTSFVDTQDVNNQIRSSVQSYITFSGGLSLFFPPSFEYSR
jgi:outer membrane beta-barrel protein